MVKASTCAEIFQGHCNHWGLTESAHALLHAQSRLIDEVAAEDLAGGLSLEESASKSSIFNDGPRLEALLRDEGYEVVPMVGRH
jgi:hypothetical protein